MLVSWSVQRRLLDAGPRPETEGLEAGIKTGSDAGLLDTKSFALAEVLPAETLSTTDAGGSTHTLSAEVRPGSDLLKQGFSPGEIPSPTGDKPSDSKHLCLGH